MLINRDYPPLACALSHSGVQLAEPAAVALHAGRVEELEAGRLRRRGLHHHLPRQIRRESPPPPFARLGPDTDTDTDTGLAWIDARSSCVHAGRALLRVRVLPRGQRHRPVPVRPLFVSCDVDSSLTQLRSRRTGRTSRHEHHLMPRNRCRCRCLEERRQPPIPRSNTRGVFSFSCALFCAGFAIEHRMGTACLIVTTFPLFRGSGSQDPWTSFFRIRNKSLVSSFSAPVAKKCSSSPCARVLWVAGSFKLTQAHGVSGRRDPGETRTQKSSTLTD